MRAILVFAAIPAHLFAQDLFGGAIVVSPSPFAAGIEIHFQRPGDIGFYGGMDTSFNSKKSDSDFYPNISRNKAEAIFGDTPMGTDEFRESYCFGLYLPATPEVSFYVGGAIGGAETYRNYYDQLQILGSDGSYWIPGGKSTGAGFQFGFVVRGKPSPAGYSYLINFGHQSLFDQYRIGVGICFSAPLPEE